MKAPLPDPALFDPVRFPGQAPDEVWPPEQFGFDAPWIAREGIQFERDASGDICVVRKFEHLRMLVGLENAHRALDIQPGTRDFRLIRLVPAALRFAETVGAGDTVPAVLRGEDMPPADEHHVYAATEVLVEAIGERAGEAGLALCQAIRRVPPGRDMFERAVAACVTDSGLEMAMIAPLARRLQRLANSHARVLAAQAQQPDYVAMERMIAATRQALVRDRRWASDLLTHALSGLEPQMVRPRETSAALAEAARRSIRLLATKTDLQKLAAEQDSFRDRLIDLAVFWQRLAAAWLAVDPETTDRRDIEALARNTIRRLKLDALYKVDPG